MRSKPFAPTFVGSGRWFSGSSAATRGLVAKDESSRYVGGRTRDWLKVKQVNWTEVSIGGGDDCPAIVFILEANRESAEQVVRAQVRLEGNFSGVERGSDMRVAILGEDAQVLGEAPHETSTHLHGT